MIRGPRLHWYVKNIITKILNEWTIVSNRLNTINKWWISDDIFGSENRHSHYFGFVLWFQIIKILLLRNDTWFFRLKSVIWGCKYSKQEKVADYEKFHQSKIENLLRWIKILCIKYQFDFHFKQWRQLERSSGIWSPT